MKMTSGCNRVGIVKCAVTRPVVCGRVEALLINKNALIEPPPWCFGYGFVMVYE